MDACREYLSSRAFLEALARLEPTPNGEEDAEVFFHSLLGPVDEYSLATDIWTAAFSEGEDPTRIATTPEAARDFCLHRLKFVEEVRSEDAAALAHAFFRMGRYESSDLAAAVAYLAGDRDARTLALLVGAGLRQGKVSEAREVLREAQERHPGDVVLEYCAATLSLAEEDTETATLRLTALTVQHPEYLPAWGLLLDVHLAGRAWSRAVGAGRIAASHHPRAAEIWLKLARAYRGQAESEQALEALRIAATCAEAMLGGNEALLSAVSLETATVFEEVGRWDEALAAYDRLLKSGQSRPAVLANRAACLKAAGRTEEAITLATDATLEHPNDAHLLSNLGEMLFEAGKDAEAFAALQRACEIDPSRAGNLILMASLCLRQRQFDAAIELGMAAVKTDPGRGAEGWVVVGDACRFLGDREAAAEAYEAARRAGAAPEELARRLGETKSHELLK